MTTHRSASRNHPFTLLLALSLLASAVQAQDSVAPFRALCAQKAAAGDAMAVAGSDGWLFLRSELRHIGVGPFWGEAAAKVSKASSPEKADPLPAIVDFNEQMKKRGIELLVVPVPCKALIYPEKLGGPAGGRLDAAHQGFYTRLADQGVKVLDLAEVFLKEKAIPAAPLLYCKTDTHWSPYACERTARLIKARIGAPAWLKPNPAAFKTRTETRGIAGDLADGKGAEELPARMVEAADGSPMEEKGSPVLLMGDSHCLVFHAGGDLQGTGAGLADQLAAELGMAVDVNGVRGSGATPARVNLLRRAKADPGYLAGKKLIVWCFAAREFTESSGWSLVPFGTPANQKDNAQP